jgi:signal transduction histidine kinase
MRHRFRIGIWRSIAVTAASLGVSSLIAFALRPFLHDQALLLPFTLAVIAVSFYGLVPGLVTTALSFVLADYFFLEPRYQLLSVYPNDYAMLIVFLIFGVMVSLLNHVRLRANLALRETNQHMEVAARELIRSNDELQRFASSVAHDLREPLHVIRAMIELFLRSNRDRLDEESARILDFVVNGSDRMKRLIDAILEFAMAGHDPNSANVNVDTDAVAKLALQHLQKMSHDAKISFDSLPVVRGNEEQLLRLFQNLIGNALKYRDKHTPEIHLSASLHADEWVFSVRDNGIGIDPEYHDRIFETFQRLHAASEYEGSGIGLATCKRIVSNHGGRIWVDSQPGKGSTFYFTIPRETEAAEATDNASIKPEPNQRNRPGKRQSRVAGG